MKRRPAYLLVTILLLLYIIMIFFCCLYNFTNSSIDLSHNILGIRADRVVHFALFFPYPFIAFLFFNYNSNIIIYKQYVISAIVISGVFLASFAEAAQELFTTMRDSDPYDLGANIIGVFAGSIIVYILRKILYDIFDPIFARKKPHS